MFATAAALHDIEKRYKTFTLGPLTLTIPAGSIVGLVGENGAGKTTTLKLLTGVIRPSAGRASCLAATRPTPLPVPGSALCLRTPTSTKTLPPPRSAAAWPASSARAGSPKLLPGILPASALTRARKSRSTAVDADEAEPCHRAGPCAELLVLDEPTSGLDPVVRGEILDLFLDFIQDETPQHPDEQPHHNRSRTGADSIAYLHKGRLLFQEDKDELLAEYGLLRCAQADLAKLPDGAAIHTERRAFGCETLVRGREAVRAALPGAVCDPAGIDDIMRLLSGRDTQ